MRFQTYFVTAMLLGAFSVGADPGFADLATLAREWAAQFQAAGPRFRDPHAAAMWGSVRSRKFVLPGIAPASRRIEIASPLLRARVHALVSLQKGAAPLMIYTPGIFVEPEGAHGFRALRHYRDLGFHVAVLPNPWSASIQKAWPPFNPGSLAEEAALHLDLVRSLLERLPRERIARVELGGESYGGLVSVAAFALDGAMGGASGVPMIDGHLSVFGPPFDLAVASARLDAMLDAADRAPECLRPWTLASVLVDFFHAQSEREISRRAARCARPLVAKLGFLPDLETASRVLEARHDLPRVPSSELRFGAFARRYPPAAGPVDVASWIARVPRERLARVRIVTTEDDFLNDPRAWAAVYSAGLPQGNLLMLPWGGHLGISSTPEYVRLLRAIFRSR